MAETKTDKTTEAGEVKPTPVKTEEPSPPPQKIKFSAPRLFEQFLLLIGFGDVLQAFKSPSRTPKRVLGACAEKLVSLLGFDGVLKTWQRPDRKTKHVLASIFNKVADTTANRLVVGSFRLLTIAAFAGFFGGSVGTTIAVVALASATGSAVYNYSKGYLRDSIAAGKPVKFFSGKRLLAAMAAFAGAAVGGAVTGAVGVWIARTPVAQGIVSALKHGFTHLTGQLTHVFNIQAAPHSAPSSPGLAPTPVLAPRAP